MLIPSAPLAPWLRRRLNSDRHKFIGLRKEAFFSAKTKPSARWASEGRITNNSHLLQSAHKPALARLVSWGTSGCDPTRMGIGPVPATRIALEKAEMTLDDLDLIEVNEAFAPQYLAVEKALNLPREKTNVNGGAISLGHPLGASGARITAHLMYALQETQGRYGLGSACIGGGQGIAVIVERL